MAGALLGVLGAAGLVLGAAEIVGRPVRLRLQAVCGLEVFDRLTWPTETEEPAAELVACFGLVGSHADCRLELPDGRASSESPSAQDVARFVWHARTAGRIDVSR